MSRRASKAFMSQPAPGYARLYYEAHITIESGPKAPMRYDQFVAKFSDDDWRASTFEHDDVDDIAGKWFMSCKAKASHAIKSMVLGMVHELRSHGLTVERWKIEEAMLDSKYGDSEETLL